MKKLYYCVGDSTEVFFKRIEECGGWPHNAKSVVYRHTVELERPCYFSILKNVRDEWNTSVYNSDEYYWWKISEDAKEKIKNSFWKEFKNKLIRYLDKNEN